ncbi:MAG: hypothetical protein U1F09_16525 [Steroidobacteraceae bacterium]
MGQDEVSCDLGGDLVWSAAFAPDGRPSPPVGLHPRRAWHDGCPLWSPSSVLPPGTDCETICGRPCACAPNGTIEARLHLRH